MSFRLRVLALVSVVALTAIGATAYLAYRQASRQVTRTITADRATVGQVVSGLADYARRHGTWYGVAAQVKALAESTGQRIRLVDEAGTVFADTDVLAGRTPRDTTGTASVVDARPRPDFAPSRTARTSTDIAVTAILRYRSEVRLADCLTRHGLAVSYSPGQHGVPEYSTSDSALRANPTAARDCQQKSTSGTDPDEARQVFQCTQPTQAHPDQTRPDQTHPAQTGRLPTSDQVLCMQRAFAELTVDVAPVPLWVYLGAAGESSAGQLAAGPVLLAGALVALLALVGTALVSRRMLRPIATLTAASQRLGEGDLSLRVAVPGRDELAQLAGSFNRMADSLQRGEQRQRRLVADVAHELRTPLANLRGYLEALKDGVVAPSPELFASLHEEAVLQQRIVNDLQDLALAEAGVLAYHRCPVDLIELLETCRTAHQAAAEAAGVTLSMASRGRVLVQADPDRLRQVFGNLVSNALKATPAGGSVTLQVARPAGGQAVVVVRDTGHGIAPGDLPHIFDRFWRADSSRARGTGGSGLGLAIARQIIVDHSGQITVESQLGAGTAVTVTLPGDEA